MDRATLEPLIENGLSTRGIASKIGKSQTATRYWLKKFDLETSPNKQTQHQQRHPSGICQLCKNPSRTTKADLCGYCHVKIRRVRIKLAAIHYKGGECQRCGWNEEIRVLQFHHSNPHKKEFQISASSHNKSWERLKAELDKCELLCPRCHSLEHMDMRGVLMEFVYNYSGNNKLFSELFSKKQRARSSARLEHRLDKAGVRSSNLRRHTKFPKKGT